MDNRIGMWRNELPGDRPDNRASRTRNGAKPCVQQFGSLPCNSWYARADDGSTGANPI